MKSPKISYSQSSRPTPRTLPTIVGLLLSALVLSTTVAPQTEQTATAAPAPAPLSHSGSIYFPETAHKVSNGFLSYWLWNGQESRWGKPISSEFVEDGLTVQYFQRGRLEYHPEAPYSRSIQPSLTGSLLARDRDFPKIAAFKSSSSTAYFAETGHSLRGGFLNYWNKYGGLGMFGYPISEEFREGGHTVQYFQRARFELTSGGGVWVGHIGVELLNKQMAEKRAEATAAAGKQPTPEFQMTFNGGATWFPGNWKRIISLNQNWGNLPSNFKGYGLYAAMPADLGLYGRWGKVTRGNKSIWVQFVDVIAYQDIPQVRADGKVIDLGVESFQQFTSLDAGVIRVTVDVAWPGFKPDFAQ